MKLLCAFHSDSNYERLQAMLSHPMIEWSENIQTETDLQERLQSGTYALLILDLRLWWSQSAYELALQRRIEVLLFDGDFKVIGNRIIERLTPLIDAHEADVAPPVLAQPHPEAAQGPVKIVEKEKIVTKERIIEKERIVEKEVKVAVPVHSYVSIPSQLCLVLNLTPRSGATFVATALASAAASRDVHCTLVEHPLNRISLFDQLNVSQLKSDYRPPLEVLDENGLLKAESELSHQGIAMYLNHPEVPNRDVTFEKIMKLIYQVRFSPLIFYDASFINDPHLFELLPEFDQVFLVIDPDPILIQRLMPPLTSNAGTNEYRMLEHLLDLERANQINLHLVVNKYNDGVDKKLLAECLPKKPLAQLPHLDPKQMYKAAWEATLVPLDKAFEDELLPVLKQVLPDAFLNQERAQPQANGWIGKLFGKK